MTVERNPDSLPETNVDETPNANEQLKKYCDTLVAHLTADTEGDAKYGADDYLAGVFVAVMRLVGGFNETIIPTVSIQHQGATMLRSLLVEAATTKQSTMANQTLLQSIEKDQGKVIDMLESIDKSCKRTVDGLGHVYRGINNLAEIMATLANKTNA